VIPQSELAQLGELQRIQQRAAELAEREAYRLFAERLPQLAAELRSTAVLQLIQ